MERSYLFNTEKIKYVKGEKPAVECILCAIRDKNPLVKDLTLFRNNSLIVALNLYPFNPGHLMIFPSRHVETISGLTEAEVLGMHKLLKSSIEIIDNEFSPQGYNVGYNLGNGSGASVSHIHQHLVPRYNNEVGFLDVFSGTRVIVMDPVEVMEKLKKKFFLLADSL